MTIRTDLLAEIDSFTAQRGIGETTFGRHALHDPTFVSRLRAGTDVKATTVEKVRRYIAEQRAALGLPDAAQVAAAERRATRKQRAARVPDLALPLPPTPPARRKRAGG